MCTQNELSKLYTVLVERFSTNELKNLCFHLNVDFDVLPGEEKESKTRELLLFLKRRNKIDELISMINRLRPDITYKDIKIDSPLQVRLSILDIDGWHLRSGELRNRAWPEKFHIPDKSERHELHLGTFAKLIFEFSANDDPDPEVEVERLWVKVLKRRSQYYIGELANEPLSGELNLGDEIVFLPEHVIAILND